MSRTIVLDTGVLGLVTHPRPHRSPEAAACQAWLAELARAGDAVAIPEIADYELRREYLRGNEQRALWHLDQWAAGPEYIPLTTEAMRQAARFWAEARTRGQLPAARHDLNADLILCAQAVGLTLPGQPVLVATTNVRHLAPFVDARLWTQI